MNLLGAWVLDEKDVNGRANLGDVLLQFDGDGNLIYVIRGKEADQIIKLRYEIDGDTIITNQPSAPHTERTIFSLKDKKLMLAFGNVPFYFNRLE